jgi:hypothetical protein
LRVHPSRKPSNVFSRGRGQTTTTIGDRDSANPEANGDYSLIKSGQLFIGPHNETLSVAMRVDNPDCVPVIVEGGDPAHAESGFDDIVNDDLPVFPTPDSCVFALHAATKK